jgi:hypothetical protein
LLIPATEARQEPVTGDIDLLAAKPIELLANRFVTPLHEIPQRRSPNCAASAVEPTTSVNSTVPSTLHGPRRFASAVLS